MSAIDRSRGAHIRIHGSGMRVVMYPDSPGEYFDGVGKPTTEKIAKEAGFDVELHQKQKRRNAAKRKFEDTLDIHFDEAQDALAKLLDEDPNAADGLDIREIQGRHFIVDSKGNKVTPNGADFEECAIVYRSLTGKRYEPKEGDPSAGTVNATNAAVKLAKEHDIDLTQVTRSGVDGRISKADVQAAVDAKDDDDLIGGGDDD